MMYNHDVENKPVIDQNAFHKLFLSWKVPSEFDEVFLYETYTYAVEGVSSIAEEASFVNNLGLNHLQIILYIVNEHGFYLSTHKDKKQEDLVKSEEYQSFLASVALDKYFTNEHLAYRMGSLTNRFSPNMSTIDLYLNFILGMLSRYKQGDPKQTLIVDILNKGFQVSKCVASLLEGGYETEAFSTWRTLHENECILQILVKYGLPVMERYLKHIRYGIAFRGGLASKEETDAVFVEIKATMKEIGLKSKDMKRFIEYGWLLGVPNVMEMEDFKFNFRDGVERVANLRQYSKVYEMSSEVAHSSPILIYSKKNYFYSVAILNLYESFFRLEKIFTSLYMSTVSEEERSRYVKMRNLYYWELMAAYEQEKHRFALLNELLPKRERTSEVESSEQE